MLNFKKTTFLKSAFTAKDFPDSNFEVAFCGRSNVGKSSTLNLLTGQRKLAKVSKTPGRTQSINFFTLEEKTFLVDLPGYGYAKVSQEMKHHWELFLKNYILKRNQLVGIIVVMDCRHPFTALDQTFIKFCTESGLYCHVLLNKADKLSNNEKAQILHKNITPILLQYPQISFQFFSALSGNGLDELKAKIAEWAGLSNNVTNVT